MMLIASTDRVRVSLLLSAPNPFETPQVYLTSQISLPVREHSKTRPRVHHEQHGKCQHASYSEAEITVDKRKHCMDLVIKRHFFRVHGVLSYLSGWYLNLRRGNNYDVVIVCVMW